MQGMDRTQLPNRPAPEKGADRSGIAALLPRHVPDEIARDGGALSWRAGALVLALLVNLAFYLPALPQDLPGSATPGIDKLVHVVVFALTVWAAGRLLAPRRRFPIGWVVLVALAHAVLIELVQIMLPGRSGELLDVLADVVGIALGVVAWAVERTLRRAARERELPDQPL